MRGSAVCAIFKVRRLILLPLTLTLSPWGRGDFYGDDMFLTAEGFCGGQEIAHGFFTRNGGVSEGIYRSLNCGYGSADDPEAVTENRRRVVEALGDGQLLTVHQIHSAECVIVREPWERGGEPKLDALATDQAGVILGILTADCGPVLFHGMKKGGSPVIGAAHAGWGGAVGGVLENTIAAMLDLGAEKASLRAALGPCIGPGSYEVSEGFQRPFVHHHSGAVEFFRKTEKDDRYMFDLPSYIEFRLRGAGVTRIVTLRRDTCAEPDHFFSYRRSQLQGEPDYGRQVSVIAIAG